MKIRSALLTIGLICCLGNVSQSKNHFDGDSSKIKQPALETRHLSYIYDFILNAALHQHYIYPHSRLLRSYSQWAFTGDKVYILTDVLPIDSNALLRFIYPDTLYGFEILESAHDIISTNPFVSQYHLEILPPFGMDTLKGIPILENPLGESDEPEIAVLFSNIYQNQNSLYIKVGIAHNKNKWFSSITSSAHIFEFEWCESVKVVYPRKVTGPYFHSNPNSRETIEELNSLPCYRSDFRLER